MPALSKYIIGPSNTWNDRQELFYAWANSNCVNSYIMCPNRCISYEKTLHKFICKDIFDHTSYFKAGRSTILTAHPYMSIDNVRDKIKKDFSFLQHLVVNELKIKCYAPRFSWYFPGTTCMIEITYGSSYERLYGLQQGGIAQQGEKGTTFSLGEYFMEEIK